MSPSHQKPYKEPGLWEELLVLIPPTLNLWAVSAPGPTLTGLPDWEEVETDPSQTVASQAVRAVGRWGSLIGSGYQEETPSEGSREDGSLVRRRSKGKRLRGCSKQAAHVKGPMGSKLV